MPGPTSYSFESYKRKFFTFDFWDSVFVKISTTLTSVKVWGLIAVTWISTWLLLHGYLDGGNWTTTITAVYATIYGMREIFKISKLNTEFSDVMVDGEDEDSGPGRLHRTTGRNMVSSELPDDGFQIIK